MVLLFFRLSHAFLQESMVCSVCMLFVVACFYIALFSFLEQTQCTLVVCVFEQVTVAFSSVL